MWYGRRDSRYRTYHCNNIIIRQPYNSFLLYARAALAWTEKSSLSDEKLKANRASETEEQRKERLRIRREKDRAKGEPKKQKRERKGRQKQKTTRNST